LSDIRVQQAKQTLQATLQELAAGNKELDATLIERQRMLDEALTAKSHLEKELRNMSAQLKTNQHKSFEMMEVLETTREELAAAKSRALEQENRAHKMATRLAEAKTAGGNVEAELHSCLEKFAKYKQDLDDLKENSVPLNRHRQCVNELSNFKAGFEALELENAMKAEVLRTETEARAKEVQEVAFCCARAHTIDHSCFLRSRLN
jgi:chromosome segregation ATPase